MKQSTQHKYPLRCSAVLLPVLAGLLIIPAALAQEDKKPQNMLKNGDFESSPSKVDNLLDGVNKQGNLQVNVVALPTVGTGGSLQDRNLPPDVQLVDLNKDGKVDIVAALPEGFIYVYYNIGEDPTKPAFDHAEIMPVFLSVSRYGPQPFVNRPSLDYSRRAPRVEFFLTDGGSYDLLLGNIFGELFHLRGSNNPTRVLYPQPPNVEGALIPTSKQEGHYWGNLFSPEVVDLNQDGNLDILIGDGGYSANSVFFIKGGNTTFPARYSEQDRTFLVTGEGREQLVPTVVDVNDDGHEDVLVADKVGEITVHYRPENWKGELLEASSTLSVGGEKRIGKTVTIDAADYNGDGLFDLLVGDSGGEIKIAINQGEKGAPKFPKLEAIKGKDRLTESLEKPQVWRADMTGSRNGTPMGYFTVFTAPASEEAADSAPPLIKNAEPPSGKNVLFAGHFPSLNKIMPPPQPTMAHEMAGFKIDQPGTFDEGEKYTLKFSAKGNQVGNFTSYTWGRVRQAGELGVERTGGRRGVAQENRRQSVWVEQTQNHSVSSSWREYTWPFTVRSDNRAIRGQKNMGLQVGFHMELNSPESFIYIDNVQLYRGTVR